MCNGLCQVYLSYQKEESISIQRDKIGKMENDSDTCPESNFNPMYPDITLI